MKLYQYNINNGGECEDDWDFPIFSFTKITSKEFKAIIEKAHDVLLENVEEIFIRPSDIADTIVQIDDRFFHSKIVMSAVVHGWNYDDEWEKKFSGIYFH